jgi:hypothetical protein
MIISHKYHFIFIKTAKTAGTSIEVFLSPLCGESDILTPFSEPEPWHDPRNYTGWFNPMNDLKTKWDFMRRKRNSQAVWPIRETLSYFSRKIKYYHHIPAWQIRNRLPPDIWQNYYKFCIERNPYDKVISAWSWYKHKKGTEITLDGYLKKCEQWMGSRDHAVGIWPYNYLNYTEPNSDKLMVDKIVYYEHLKDELPVIFKQLNIDAVFDKFPTSKGGLRNGSDYREILTPYQRNIIDNLFVKEFEMHGYLL